MKTISPFDRVFRTRFAELGYVKQSPGLWRFVDLTGDRPATVGPFYASKAELLGDLTRYATDYGATEGTKP